MAAEHADAARAVPAQQASAHLRFVEGHAMIEPDSLGG